MDTLKRLLGRATKYKRVRNADSGLATPEGQDLEQPESVELLATQRRASSSSSLELQRNELRPRSQPSSTYLFSPTQSWLTPTIQSVKRSDHFDESRDLPHFAQNTAFMKEYAKPLFRRSLFGFICQSQVGGLLLLGGLFNLLAIACQLSAPEILRLVLEKKNTEPPFYLTVALFVVSLLAAVFGRAKDQVCRIQSDRISVLLQSAIFEKSLKLSPNARKDYPASKVISVSTNDVSFLGNYFVKAHDVWSSPLQMLVIFAQLISIVGWLPCISGFIAMAFLFISQSWGNDSTRESVGGYLRLNDDRLKHLREFLYGVKGIKMQSFEEYFLKKIRHVRRKQLAFLGKWLKLTFCFFTSVNQMIPGLAAASAFAVYWGSGNNLRVDVVFPALTLFNMTYEPASKLSISITRHFSVGPCVSRVLDLLTAEEDVDQSNAGSVNVDEKYLPSASDSDSDEGVDLSESHKCAVMLDGKFVYPGNDSFELDIDELRIPRGKLTVVVGAVGSGKSSLLNTILGLLVPLKKTQPVATPRSVAISAQEPFLFCGTVRENIVFTSRDDEERYRAVIRMCCLEEDIRLLPGGDDAAVGEKGANLSGGQKARVSLARAVYSDSNLMLFDDCLAAVDARVSKKLFHGCVRKLATGKDRTVVLATHNTSFLRHADYIVVIKDGKLVERGTADDILRSTSDYARSFMHLHPIGATDYAEDDGPDEIDLLEDPNGQKPAASAPVAAMTEEEERASGSVDSEIYLFYGKHAGGLFFMISVAVTFVLLTAIRAVSAYWLVWWLKDSFHIAQSGYISAYTGLMVLQSLLLAGLGIVLVRGSLKASLDIHSKVVSNLFRAYLWYFEAQPIGRILNRLSSDIEAIDARLMNAVDGLFVAAGSLAASLLIIMVTAPFLIAFVLPLLLASYWLQSLFRVSARELRRVTNLLASPVIATVSETLQAAGTGTLKAYHAEGRFMRKHSRLLDRHMSASIAKHSLDTWVTFRAECLTAFLVLFAGALRSFGWLDHVRAGLALSTAVTLSNNAYLLLWSLISLEVEMNSVERLKHYATEIPTETDTVNNVKPIPLPAPWPMDGSVGFDKLTLRYRTREEPALDNLTINIPSGQHVGIVGRTGSGKSTLVSTLSRLVDASSGSVELSGADVARVPLQRVRDAVGVLPQEPVLFEGTLRQNLDPKKSFGGDDASLWAALDACNLRSFTETSLASKRKGLDGRIESGGSNVSAGQKQLVCVARALLRKPKVLVVDEATANVDVESEKIISKAIKEHFRGTTVLCVAHRITALIGMDRILVMKDGKIEEDGSPLQLLETRGSVFRALMWETGGEDLVRDMVEQAKQEMRNKLE